jgi:hypothetical protein
MLIYFGYVDVLLFDNELRLSNSIYSKSDVFVGSLDRTSPFAVGLE